MKLREKFKRFWTMDVHNHEGFTLVELIIVIAILAILSGVAVAGYSAYIKKANKAADDALLYEINLAFNSACVDNMTDASNITKATWDMDNMTVKSVEGQENHPIVASFAEFFDVANAKFKVIESIWFNPVTHVWEEDDVVTYTFNGTTIKLNASDVAILAGDNAFSDRGAAALLNDVGVLENLLGTGIGADVLEAVKYSDDFLWALGSYAGMTKGADESDDDYLDRVAAYMMDPSNEEAVYSAQIMYAASQAANSNNTQIDELFTGTITSNIEVKGENGETDYAQTMANAALAYGMYTAYLQRHPEVDPDSNTGNFTNVVNSDAFKAYLASEEGQADLEAYMAAMNMISDNTGNSEVTGSILDNGIVDNEELEELLKDIMGN